MKRGGSVHINRCEKPGFDFLVVRKLSGTPQPAEIKKKKMFLSLYRTLKLHRDVPTPMIQKRKTEAGTRYYPESFIIESLVSAKIKTRVTPKASIQSDKKPKNLYCGRIKVNIQTRKTTPFTTSIMDDTSSWA